jgi:hypothetical protein
MIFLVVQTYNNNIRNISEAIDNYFCNSQLELQTWLKKINYSKFMTYKEFQTNFKIEDVDDNIISSFVHLILVGVKNFNINYDQKLNLIIYPFDKTNSLKNDTIKGILSNQLLLLKT